MHSSWTLCMRFHNASCRMPHATSDIITEEDGEEASPTCDPDVKLSKRCKQKWRICINARLLLKYDARGTSQWHRLHSGTEWVSVFSSGIWLPFGIWSALQFTCGCFWDSTHSESRKDSFIFISFSPHHSSVPCPLYNWICALRVHQAFHLFCNYSTRA